MYVTGLSSLQIFSLLRTFRLKKPISNDREVVAKILDKN